jgi:heme exporter protein C
MSAVQNLSTQPSSKAEAASGIAAWPPLLRILTIVTVLAVAFGLYMALAYAGTDVTQGEVQRIFYIHVSAFSGAFVAFCATVVGGIAYLRTRNVKWDTLALAGVEVGFALALVNLVTGSIWARPIWNTWWTWDPRLTSAAIMCLTYAAYLMLRNGIENAEQRRRFASIYGILAIVTVIVTLVIIRIEPRTIHPAVIGASPQNAEGQFEMTQRMTVTLGINSAIWSILVPATLIWHRIRLQNRIEQVEALKAEVLNQ